MQTIETYYRARLQVLCSQDIPLQAAENYEIVKVRLANKHILFISLKPHKDAAGKIGFLHRRGGEEEWKVLSDQEFLPWLRKEVGLTPASAQGLRLDFGKFRGMLVKDIIVQEQQYFTWVIEKTNLGIRKKKELVDLMLAHGLNTVEIVLPPYEPTEEISEKLSRLPPLTTIKFDAEESVFSTSFTSGRCVNFNPAPDLFVDILHELQSPPRRKKKIKFTHYEVEQAVEVVARRRKLALLGA